jgi:hypothetical protein
MFSNEYGRSHAHDGIIHDLESMIGSICNQFGFSFAQPHLPMNAVSVFDLLGQRETVLWSFDLTSKSLSNRLLREHILQNATNTFYLHSERNWLVTLYTSNHPREAYSQLPMELFKTLLSPEKLPTNHVLHFRKRFEDFHNFLQATPHNRRKSIYELVCPRTKELQFREEMMPNHQLRQCFRVAGVLI